MEPSATAGSTVNVSQVGLARPVLNATGGARRKRGSRKHRPRTHKKIMKGGFFPGVMGSFLHNAKSTLHYFLVGSASGFASMFAPSTTRSI